MPIISLKTVAFLRKTKGGPIPLFTWYTKGEKYLQPPKIAEHKTYKLKFSLDLDEEEIVPDDEPEEKKSKTPEPEKIEVDKVEEEVQKKRILDENELSFKTHEQVISFLRKFVPLNGKHKINSSFIPKNEVEEPENLLARAFEAFAYNVSSMELMADLELRSINSGLAFRQELSLTQFANVLVALCSGVKVEKKPKEPKLSQKKILKFRSYLNRSSSL